jgi:nucleoside-diphosphate-sugar epimerase
MKIVVTGGTGFIGAATVPQLLAAGHDVHLLGRSAIAGCTLHPCDLLAEDTAPLLARIGADALLHLAWYAKPGAFWHAPENLDWVAASLQLIRGFAASGGKRVVVAGTCAEYDWGYATLDAARTPLVPRTLYGRAKASLFALLMAAARDLGLSLAWGRIFFPYGPFEAPGRLFSGIVDGIAAGETVACSAGLQCRDFMHVDDVARAFALLVAHDLTGPINIASGATVAVRDFIVQAAAFAGDASLVRLGARPMQPGEPPYMAANVEPLVNTLKFRPRFDLAAGLADAVARRRTGCDF